MTAEAILEKHLLTMLNRTDNSCVTIDEMKTLPEWQSTINAMIEYADQQVKKLNSSDVIQSLPSDDVFIELAKNNCVLHRTSEELGFLVTFDLNGLRQFCSIIN